MTKKIDNIAEYSRPNRLPRLMGPGRREIRSARAPSVSLALALRRAATTRRLLDLAVEIDPTMTLFQDRAAAAGSACYQILSGLASKGSVSWSLSLTAGHPPFAFYSANAPRGPPEV